MTRGQFAILLSVWIWQGLLWSLMLLWLWTSGRVCSS